MTLATRVLVGLIWVGGLLAITTPWTDSAVSAGPKPQDVVVINSPAAPVPVTGMVQVVNQPIQTPYLEFGSAAMAAGDNIAQIEFDVPEGTRLVLETLSVQVGVPTTQKVRVFLDVLEGITPVLSVVPMQSPGPILGNEYYVANQPFRLHKNAISGSVDEIRVRVLRDSTVGTAGLLATLHGYTVDSN